MKKEIRRQEERKGEISAEEEMKWNRGQRRIKSEGKLKAARRNEEALGKLISKQRIRDKEEIMREKAIRNVRNKGHWKQRGGRKEGEVDEEEKKIKKIRKRKQE